MATKGDRPPLQRDALVAGARELIVAEGLDALSLRRLATKLGVTAPALYAHVDSKEDLLRAVAAVELATLGARFQALSVDDPLERMRAHARLYVAHARANPELFRVMFLFPPEQVPVGVDAPALPAATSAFTVAATAVDDAMAAGLMESADPLLVALTLWSAAHGVATVLQLGIGLPDHLTEALIDEVTDRLIAGYRPSA